MNRNTYTYALIPVSKAVFDEISQKLMEAGNNECVLVQKDNAVHLDMNGLALVTEDEAETIRQGVG